MSKEMKLIPELRFTEFTGKDGWKNSKLLDVLFEHKETSDGSEEVYSVSVHKGIVNQIEHLGRRFAASSTDNYKRVFPGDVVYTKSPTGDFPFGIIKQNKSDKPVIVSPLYGVFTPETKWLGLIIDAYFESPQRTYNYLESIVQKGAKNTINIRNDVFLSKHLVLPRDREEQQKIASCLSSLDELIAAHKDKLVALKEHKKGLLQNLFPQEGETVPKVRFPEFEDDAEWVETKLDKHLEITSGYAFKSKFFSDSGRKLVTPKNFTKEGRANFIKEYTKHTTEDFKSKYLCKPGDLLVLLTDLTPSCELLGKPILLRSEDGEVLLNQRIIKLEVSKDLKKDFLFQFFLTSDFHRRVKSTASGTTVRHSSNKIILGTSLLIPRNTKEQKKIASLLSNLDELIEVQGQKIEQLQDHKKGLLQGLFPKIQF